MVTDWQGLQIKEFGICLEGTGEQMEGKTQSIPWRRGHHKFIKLLWAVEGDFIMTKTFTNEKGQKPSSEQLQEVVEAKT